MIYEINIVLVPIIRQQRIGKIANSMAVGENDIIRCFTLFFSLISQIALSILLDSILQPNNVVK